MMEQLLLNDRDMRKRLSRIENSQILQRSSTNTMDDDQSTIKAPSIRSKTSKASTITDRPLIDRVDSDFTLLDEGLAAIQGESEFEAVLGASRVYRRATLDDCDVSFTSSNALSHAWSALSGFSLADISVISVLALPLDPEIEAVRTLPTPWQSLQSTLSSGPGNDVRQVKERGTKSEVEMKKVRAIVDDITNLFPRQESSSTHKRQASQSNNELTSAVTLIETLEDVISSVPLTTC
jgi:hypothetical protein